MKTIGLLGGMSWESTIPYYRLINEGVKQRLGWPALGTKFCCTA
ncbi:Asp/Glu/Hydantoin racemase [Citrobacter braakii]|nr:Asp/Glu/Hydantoin racemase [Citrobacter braakii]